MDTSRFVLWALIRFVLIFVGRMFLYDVHSVMLIQLSPFVQLRYEVIGEGLQDN